MTDMALLAEGAELLTESPLVPSSGYKHDLLAEGECPNSSHLTEARCQSDFQSMGGNGMTERPSDQQRSIPDDIFGSDEPEIYSVVTKQPGPAGLLPLTAVQLLDRPSGDLFGWSQNVGMGWEPGKLGRPEMLILSTQGGIRLPDGTPLALGYHTGHWEVGLLMKAAAEELRRLDCIPFAGYCTDPCDGRTQGTVGMFDSLPFRNDAAIVLRRLIR